MNSIVLHDAFVGEGCAGRVEARPAVSIEAGAIWGHVYAAVMAKAGRYVQGGGCTTVGVAGLINGGGFGSLSKTFGLGGASLLEAEVVTADGEVRIANACTNADLLWALKGGGAGFGVVTRLTLQTHALPNFVGGVFATCRAKSDEAYRRLVAKTIDFYAETLFNPQWGEQLRFAPGSVLSIMMVFADLDQGQAQAVWRPFFDWVSASPQDFEVVSPPVIAALTGRQFWDPAVLRRFPGLVIADDRPGAPDDNIFWAGDGGQAGQTLYAYQSQWLPAALLEPGQRSRLVDALLVASTHSGVSLHVNKGLAGARPEAIAAARETPMNGAVADAFALVIAGAEGPPAYPGIAGPRTGRGQGPRPRRGRDRGDGRTAQARSQARVLCLGDGFLRSGMAGRLLGRQLRAAAGDQGEVRPGRSLRPSPRCRQRGLERGRLHAQARALNASRDSNTDPGDGRPDRDSTLQLSVSMR